MNIFGTLAGLALIASLFNYAPEMATVTCDPDLRLFSDTMQLVACKMCN